MLEFLDVIACGMQVHCYLDRYYIGHLSEHSGKWRIFIEHKWQGDVRSRDEAEEVVRMWVRKTQT